MFLFIVIISMILFFLVDFYLKNNAFGLLEHYELFIHNEKIEGGE